MYTYIWPSIRSNGLSPSALIASTDCELVRLPYNDNNVERRDWKQNLELLERYPVSRHLRIRNKIEIKETGWQLEALLRYPFIFSSSLF